jgi:hypothetical protein
MSDERGGRPGELGDSHSDIESRIPHPISLPAQSLLGFLLAESLVDS